MSLLGLALAWLALAVRVLAFGLAVALGLVAALGLAALVARSSGRAIECRMGRGQHNPCGRCDGHKALRYELGARAIIHGGLFVDVTHLAGAVAGAHYPL